MASRFDRAIAALAARQHGFVTRRQLCELGLGDGAIAHRTRRGWLIPVHAGVYAVGHLPVSPIARAAAVVLACGPGAALSHHSAATLWGFRRRWSHPLQVTVASDRRRPGVQVHRARTLARADVTTHMGIRVTSPARTILDVAPALGEKPLTRMVNDALISSHLRLPALAELLDRCPRHPGTKRLRRFVEEAAGPTRSQLEDEFLDFTRRFGLPQPEMNARVGGYEVDALFRPEQVIVELDGFTFHRGRSQFERDRDRDAHLLALDFETVRITRERMRSAPAREAERLMAILVRRRVRGRPA